MIPFAEVSLLITIALHFGGFPVRNICREDIQTRMFSSLEYTHSSTLVLAALESSCTELSQKGWHTAIFRIYKHDVT